MLKNRVFFRIAAAGLIISVLFSQLGVNLMHTHQGSAPESVLAYKADNGNGSTPCKVCSLDVIPTLYFESYQLVSLVEPPAFFAETSCADVLLPVSSPSLGRAPPAI